MNCLIDSKFLAGWHWNLAFNHEKIEIIKRNIKTLNNHIPHSAQFHNMKHIFLHIFICKQEGIFNVYKTVKLFPILTT